MITLFFYGVDLKLNGLKAITAFRNAQVLSEKGKEAKIGFKKGKKADFSMAMVSIDNGYDNVDEMLFETMELLRNNNSGISDCKTESISIQIHLKTAKDVEFSIDNESIRFNKKIPVDVVFEIEQDQSQVIETVVSDLIKKYRLRPIKKYRQLADAHTQAERKPIPQRVKTKSKPKA